MCYLWLKISELFAKYKVVFTTVSFRFTSMATDRTFMLIGQSASDPVHNSDVNGNDIRLYC